MARFDHELRHLYVNPTVERMSGISTDHFIGRTNKELGMPQSLVRLWNEKLIQTFETGLKTDLEFEYDTPDGVRYFQSIIAPEFTDADSVDSLLCVTRDITERKLAEECVETPKDEAQRTSIKPARDQHGAKDPCATPRR